jgi:DNA polymerase-3 subunit chi
VRKAYRSGSRVLVTAPAPLLARLDEALWTFEERDFIPHLRLPAASADLAARTPLWLATAVPAGEVPPLLVNLGAATGDDPQRFERVIELVGVDADARQTGRAHWRHYLSWGVTPLHHDSAA